MPDTITIDLAALVRFLTIACPAAVLGWFGGMALVALTLSRAGFKLRSKGGKPVLIRTKDDSPVSP